MDLQTRDWVARAVGRDARVVAVRRLPGGITSAVHRLSVETRRGTRTQVVLRRWVPTAWSDGADGSELVGSEAGVLRELESSAIPAPRVLASDPTGVATGAPAILMTRVPGRVDLAPADRRAWLRQIVTMAVRVHDLGVDVERYGWEPKDVPMPDWASRPQVWHAAAAMVAGEPPGFQERFAHGDYQHFNLLWQRGRLTGVVDWTGSFRGPADVDVGHCRLNLAVLYSAELAAEFLAAYEAEAGRRIDPYWDLRCVTSPARTDWASFIPLQVGGRIPFDPVSMHRRVEELLATAMARV